MKLQNNIFPFHYQPDSGLAPVENLRRHLHNIITAGKSRRLCIFLCTGLLSIMIYLITPPDKIRRKFRKTSLVLPPDPKRPF